MVTCPSCGEQNRERARFCVACGSALERGRDSDEPRKMVTVVFAELVTGDRSPSEDPEELHSLLRAYRALVSRFVTSHGGTVDKFMGRVALCVFGAPITAEVDGLLEGTPAR